MTAPQNLIAGVDEAGRGPWAGPVVAAACILPVDFPEDLYHQLDDSKKLSAKKREMLAVEIKKYCIWSVAQIDVEIIDQINILQATMQAMQLAITKLGTQPSSVLIDGNMLPKDLLIPATAVIKGDQKHACISAASILAKTHRDNIMSELAKDFPAYGWERNAGYGTKAHQEALQKHGITPHHRKSFKPIAEIINLYLERA